MKMRNNNIFILLTLFILSFWITYWIYLYNGTWITQMWVWWVNTSSSIWFTPKSYDKFSVEYTTQNKRQYFEEWEFESEVFWIFIPEGRVDLYKNSSVNSNCEDWETVSYYFDWNFKNKDTSKWGIDSWWKWYKTEIDPALNYYCPDSWNFSIKLVSRESEIFFDTIVVSNGTVPNYYVIEVKDSNGNLIELDERVIFSKSKLQIWWVINTNSTIEEEFVWWNMNQKNASELLSINFDVSNWVWNITQFMTNIKKNVSNQTKWMTWTTIEGSRNNLQTYMLYNFEWIENTLSSNIENKWKIVTLNNSWNWLRVNGENTIIIKWWNLYIRDDIYSVNKTDILTIVVLRDETNKKNGWNVYIDPYVTNIDAIIISEWSVMSYNGTQVIDSTTHTNNLKRQLFIYWNLITRNTIWQNKAIFNTDDYITSGTELITTKYNLENLRSFQLVKTEQITSWPCTQSDKITAMWNTEIESIDYAFAWKKECYFDGDTKIVTWWNLRSTHRVASTVIEYNPNIQVNSPKIIKIY